MDDISNTLNNSRKGCIMNGVPVNQIMYADDVVLIAPSAHALQLFLSLCDSYASCHGIVYNTKKTVCMCVKPKQFKSNIVHEFLLSGNNRKYVVNHKYLGVQLTANYKDDSDIRQQCRNVYSRGNMLIRNFKTCSNHLFKTFCSNICCSTLWCRFTDESMRRLKVAYNRIFRIPMGLEHRTSMSAEFIVRDMDPFAVILRKAIASFRKGIFSNDNILVRTAVDSVFFTFCRLSRRWSKALFVLH